MCMCVSICSFVTHKFTGTWSCCFTKWHCVQILADAWTTTRAMRTSMTLTTSTTSTRTPTRASCTTCEQALRARSFVAPLDVCVTCTSWLKVFLSLIPSTFIVIHERFSLTSLSSLSTSTCLSPSSSSPLSWCTLSSTLSSTTWSPCNTTCARPRTRGERRLRRPHLPHRLWAQRHGLQRARQLSGFLLRHYTVIGLGHWRRYTRQAAHRGTPRTSRLLQSRRRVSQSSLSVVFDRTGKPVWERDVDQSIGFGVTRNTYSAHSKFSENTQAEKVVDRTGKLVGENSANAQIRTLLDEQRQMIIAEYCEKIGHHELQAARAEGERRILREELWRQHMDFREVHQKSLTEMEELRKFQSSTFDTFARRKLIEDQNTIMKLSSRVQELQNDY